MTLRGRIATLGALGAVMVLAVLLVQVVLGDDGSAPLAERAISAIALLTGAAVGARGVVDGVTRGRTSTPPPGGGVDEGERR